MAKLLGFFIHYISQYPVTFGIIILTFLLSPIAYRTHFYHFYHENGQLMLTHRQYVWGKILVKTLAPVAVINSRVISEDDDGSLVHRVLATLATQEEIVLKDIANFGYRNHAQPHQQVHEQIQAMLANTQLPPLTFSNQHSSNLIGIFIMGVFMCLFTVPVGLFVDSFRPKDDNKTATSTFQATTLPPNSQLLSDLPKAVLQDLPFSADTTLVNSRFDEKYRLWHIMLTMPCQSANALTTQLKTEFNNRHWQTSNVQDFPAYDANGNKKSAGDSFNFGIRREKGASEGEVSVSYVAQTENCSVAYSTPSA